MPDSTGVLVGRRAELETLTGVLSDLRGGACRIVQIAGEQGIGKTRLVSEACGEAERCRCLVFCARSAELGAGEAFGVLIDALDDYLASLERRDLEGVERELDELAWVFPAIARLVERPAAMLAAERFRAHRAVRALLGVLGARRPMVLALDDVHWADEASTEFVSYLLRRPPRGPVLTLLAFRPAQLEPRFEAALDAATATPACLPRRWGAGVLGGAGRLLRRARHRARRRRPRCRRCDRGRGVRRFRRRTRLVRTGGPTSDTPMGGGTRRSIGSLVVGRARTAGAPRRSTRWCGDRPRRA